MNLMIREQGLESAIVCDSAGIGAWHVGNPPDPRMSEAALNKLNLKLQGAARQFQPSDLKSFDLILAMDRENYRDIMQFDPEGHYRPKVKLMCEYCRLYREDEVPDPYYGGPEGFNYVLDLLMDACAGLLTEIRQTQAV